MNPMTLTIALLGIFSVGTLIFLAGWLLAQQDKEQKVTAAYNGAKVMQRSVDLTRLAHLRRNLEDDDEGMLAADAYLLFDVCEALRLSEGETQHILGPAYWLLIDAPVDLGIEVDDECS